MLNKINKINKLMTREQVLYLALAILAALLFVCYQKGALRGPSMYGKLKSGYSVAKAAPAPAAEAPAAPVSAGVAGLDIDSVDQMYAPASLEGQGIDLKASCASMNGVGLASSLLPREAASQEEFGEFAPDDVLKGQSFLSTRELIGMPETLGGSLRNANQSIRAEPPNPKSAFVWQNSTIPPDTMQRPLV